MKENKYKNRMVFITHSKHGTSIPSIPLRGYLFSSQKKKVDVS